MGEKDPQFREFRDHDGGHLEFGGPAVAASEFFERAWCEADDLESLSFPDGPDLVPEDIEQSGTAVIGEEGLLDRQHPGLQIIDESQDRVPPFLQGFVRGLLFLDYLDAVIDELAVFEDRHAHVPGPRIDGQDSLIGACHFVLKAEGTASGSFPPF